MNRYERYLSLSADIIESYNGSEPFASFLKKYFSQNKQLGSRDRKQISQCCYAYFRAGHLLDGLNVAKQIPASLFLCTNDHQEIIENLYPEWFDSIHCTVEEKCQFLGIEWNAGKLFPWKNYVSDEVDADAFIINHLSQPDLFLRIRNTNPEAVISKLDKAGISYRLIGNTTIQMPNGSKVDKVLAINREVVVQDYSSQKITDFFQYLSFKTTDTFKVWDTCAASGGKSILLKDYFPNTLLTVSDIRESILVNLDKRFIEAGLKYEQIFTADLSKGAPPLLQPESFDLIIADVPCTGSGTWSRNPEWLKYFKEEQIAAYADLQSAILNSIIPFLKRGSFLLYATCSVFKQENELQILSLKNEFDLELVASGVIKGYTHKADTMYGAILKKKE